MLLTLEQSPDSPAVTHKIRSSSDSFSPFFYRWSAVQDIPEDRKSDSVRNLLFQLPGLKGKETGFINHVIRTSEIACMIAAEFDLEEDWIEEIRTGTLLHDIGKCSLPAAVLDSSKILTRKEYEIVKTHSLLGYEILGLHEPFELYRSYALFHHEKFDGSGYPFGISGFDIPEEARILSLADAMESMTGNRPYRRRKSLQEAVFEVERCSGSHFDPDIVSAFKFALKKKEFRRLFPVDPVFEGPR